MTRPGNGSKNKLAYIDLSAMLLMIVLFVSATCSIAGTQGVNVNGKWLNHQQILRLEDKLGHRVPKGFYKYGKLYGFRATGEVLNGNTSRHKIYGRYSDNRYSGYLQEYPRDISPGRYRWFERTLIND